ncbi:CMP/dCMP kinase [Nematocida sp. LUAm3]|nr:CMP/dCMP kinase [Nematocida sp. LUAm3]KAI5174083.1 CMP/dCMP kinase [Nematocida sp. LUAm2]KAI5177174.1 CMP/dCMP kinase [Nematocida sp. LUAm1]
MGAVFKEKKPFRIAIDGPAGAGKSTLASALAKKINFTHINTGLIYRAISYMLMQHNTIEDIKEKIEEKDPEVLEAIRSFSPVIEKNDVFINNCSIMKHLRSPKIDSAVGIVAKYLEVRTKVSDIQRKQIERYSEGAVVEGRDIGTVIIPDAELKIFLMASVEVRAQRRFLECPQIPLKQIEEEIRIRDTLDATRKISPLVKAADAVVVDNSNLTINETIKQIEMLVQERRK